MTLMYLNKQRNRAELGWQEIKGSLPAGTEFTFSRDRNKVKFTEPETEYDQQAKAFLERFHLTMEIVWSGTSGPPWDSKYPHGDQYTVTLKYREGIDTLTFPFWTSFRDSYYAHGAYTFESNVRDFFTDPSPYDVLSALSGDSALDPDPDQIARDIGGGYTPSRYYELAAWGNKLRRFFRGQEVLDALNEIQ